MYFADHCLRQWFCCVPEKVEFFLDPRHTLRGLVFPQDFVVALPAVSRLVHRPDEPQPTAISQGNHTCLAVHKTADVIRRDSHRLPMLGEEGVQPPIAFAVQQCLGLQGALVPAAEHLALAQLRHFQVVWVDVHIADDLDLGDVL